ncbi:MAG: extracellular solute-binding protein [Myxococcales bacterium]
MRPAHLFLAILAVATSCSRPTELTVLHAASLRRVMADAAAVYQKENPKVRIRLEPSGSQVAIRKITEQGLRADVVAVADAQLIDQLMLPGHAAWNLEFATNEVVLAHGQHSQFTAELTGQNWPEVLLRPGVRLGRVNPDNAPLGYHALFCWQLAEKSGAFGEVGKDLATRLAQAVPKEHIGADETELLGFLESKAIDYAFLYRSTAEDHHLKFLELPAEINLDKPEPRGEVRGRSGRGEDEVRPHGPQGPPDHLRHHGPEERRQPGRGGEVRGIPSRDARAADPAGCRLSSARARGCERDRGAERATRARWTAACYAEVGVRERIGGLSHSPSMGTGPGLTALAQLASGRPPVPRESGSVPPVR